MSLIHNLSCCLEHSHVYHGHNSFGRSVEGLTATSFSSQIHGPFGLAENEVPLPLVFHWLWIVFLLVLVMDHFPVC